jgi:hypothetical protein
VIRSRGSTVAGKLRWQDQPEEHDYPAAQNYLSLLLDPAEARRVAERLRVVPIVHLKAKDILRASGLPILGPENVHVARDLDKIRLGRALSPVLLVRGRLRDGVPLTVADGYHRICASHHLDEDADIPCRLADL